MPSGQTLLNAIAASGAITYRPGGQTPFLVSYAPLRKVLRPEHRALAAAGASTRTDTGTITLAPLGGGNPVNIPATVVIGADGTSNSPNGVSASIVEMTTSGHILIAAGGDGESLSQMKRLSKQKRDLASRYFLGPRKRDNRTSGGYTIVKPWRVE